MPLVQSGLRLPQLPIKLSPLLLEGPDLLARGLLLPLCLAQLSLRRGRGFLQLRGFRLQAANLGLGLGGGASNLFELVLHLA